MDSRKVIRSHNSYYINIPSDVAQALGIVKGDRLKVTHLIGLGLLITQAQGADKIPVNLESIDRLQRATDFIYEQLKGRLKNLEANLASNFHASIIKDLVKIGIFDLKVKVEKVEKQVEESNKGKGRLTLVHKGKGSAQ